MRLLSTTLALFILCFGLGWAAEPQGLDVTNTAAHVVLPVVVDGVQYEVIVRYWYPHGGPLTLVGVGLAQRGEMLPHGLPGSDRVVAEATRILQEAEKMALAPVPQAEEIQLMGTTPFDSDNTLMVEGVIDETSMGDVAPDARYEVGLVINGQGEETARSVVISEWPTMREVELVPGSVLTGQSAYKRGRAIQTILKDLAASPPDGVPLEKASVAKIESRDYVDSEGVHRYVARFVKVATAGG